MPHRRPAAVAQADAALLEERAVAAQLRCALDEERAVAAAARVDADAMLSKVLQAGVYLGSLLTALLLVEVVSRGEGLWLGSRATDALLAVAMHVVDQLLGMLLLGAAAAGGAG